MVRPKSDNDNPRRPHEAQRPRINWRTILDSSPAFTIPAIVGTALSAIESLPLDYAMEKEGDDSDPEARDSARMTPTAFLICWRGSRHPPRD